MNLELIGALTDLEKERGISKEILLEAIEVAIVSAYKRNYGSGSAMNVRVDLNDQTGDIRVFSRRTVVEEVTDPALEIDEVAAKEIDPNYALGDIVEIEVTPKDFGRIAAQTAKQVVIQRIREAERSMVYDEYSNREGDVVTGLIQRQEYRNVIVDLDRVEAVLPMSEQILHEEYVHNTRLKFYINEVKQSTKGPQVFLSRTHPGLLKGLFELEVPEIHSGEVEIKSVAREAGYRSKVAVYSRDEAIDPVGACVGAKGIRVQAIVSELNGEKIDIIKWVPDEKVFIANALSPAKVLTVILDEENKTARTVVPDDQLSLAIGKEGQNARLAARLTGWKIDIKSETQAKDLPEFQVSLVEELETDQVDHNVVEDTVDELADDIVAVQEIQEFQEIDETKHTDAVALVTDIVVDGIVEDDAEVGEETVSVEKEEEDELEASKEKGVVEDISLITNVKKRKSWEERFGSLTTKSLDQEQESKDKTRESTGKKSKKKKEEKVLTDLSQLDLGDFNFDSEGE